MRAGLWNNGFDGFAGFHCVRTGLWNNGFDGLVELTG